MNGNIIVKIRGGLGNQLFQYAYAIKVQKKYPNKGIILDTSYFNKKHIRSLEINQLTLSSNVKLQNKSRKNFDFLYNTFLLFDKLSKHKLQLKAISFLGDYYCFCDKQATFKLKRKKINDVYLAGYFQDYNEISSLKNIIKAGIVPYSLSEKAKEYLKIILENNTLAISIRAGDDYVKFGWPVCTRKYYNAAINKMKKNNVIIIVFADVIDKTKKEKWFDNNEVVYVEGCNAVESLFLLSKCDDFIISNSTFSWWGAFLGDTSNKKIIAPEFFYANTKMKNCGLNIPGIIYLNNFTGGEAS